MTFGNLRVRLSGWQRIGIVLSCLWTIFWTVPNFFVFDWGLVERWTDVDKSDYRICFSKAETETVEIHEPVDANVCNRPYDPAQNILDRSMERYEAGCSAGYKATFSERPRPAAEAQALRAACDAEFVRSGKLARAQFIERLGSVLLPVPAAWILCWLVIATIRWIRRGFSGTKTSTKSAPDPSRRKAV